jgi:hypothetical protein
MRRLWRAVRLGTVMLAVQGLTGCAWSNNDPIEMKLQGSTAQTTPCIAGNLSREFKDTLPVVNRGNTHDSTEISVEAPRGGLLAFVKIEPLPSGDSHVTIYNGDLYWPARNTSGVFPDFLRDNWHRTERAVLACTNQTT